MKTERSWFLKFLFFSAGFLGYCQVQAYEGHWNSAPRPNQPLSLLHISALQQKAFVHPFFSMGNRLRLYATSQSALEQISTATPSPTSSIPHSFVRDELRPYAMKLHSKDQAKEGKQEAQTPFTKWTCSRQHYLQFLVDSMKVYETFERLINNHPKLFSLRQTGLERAAALEQDVQWMLQFDSSLIRPLTGEAGLKYSSFLETLVEQSLPRFICHYYNFYFAHTAGGRMIGMKMAELLLNRQTLKFYQWEGDVKALLEQTKSRIDEIAATWSEQERKECMEETLATFDFGGSLMMYLHQP